MTGTFPPPPTGYFCEEDGLTFTIETYQGQDGQFYAKITVLEGHADFNALYWGDDQDDGSQFSLGAGNSPLNMNGAKTHDGDSVDWDSGVKISSPGLGRMGVDKESYLETGDSLVVPLAGVTSLDEVETIGVRATSTSTPEGSIKCVLQADDHKDDAPEQEIDQTVETAAAPVEDTAGPEEDPADFLAQFFSDDASADDMMPLDEEDDPLPMEAELL